MTTWLPLILIWGGWATSKWASPLWRNPIGMPLVLIGWCWNSWNIAQTDGWWTVIAWTVGIVALACLYAAVRYWWLGRRRWHVHRATCQVCGEVIDHPDPDDLRHHVRLFHPDLIQE